MILQFYDLLEIVNVNFFFFLQHNEKNICNFQSQAIHLSIQRKLF